jgi:hypothetical protein
MAPSIVDEFMTILLFISVGDILHTGIVTAASTCRGMLKARAKVTKNLIQRFMACQCVFLGIKTIISIIID